MRIRPSRVAGGHVAGAKPVVVHGCGGRVGPVQIAEEQIGPAHLDLADRLAVGSRRSLARRRRPAARPPRATGAPTDPGARLAVGPDGGVHQRLGHPVALDHAAAGELAASRSCSEAGSAAEPGDQQPRAGERPRQRPRTCSAASASRRYMVGTPNSIVAPPVSAAVDAVGREPAQVHRRPAAAQRAEDPDHQPMDVEQRQPVGDHVALGPGPCVGERVEVGGDRPPRQHRALGRPGGPRGVDDQSRILG